MKIGDIKVEGRFDGSMHYTFIINCGMKPSKCRSVLTSLILIIKEMTKKK